MSAAPQPAPKRSPKALLRKLLVGCGLGLLAASFGPADAATAGDDDDEPATWRFRDEDRSVKVVVLAGSVGAWQKDPYAEHIENWCVNVEVKNLSKTGYGAYQLRQRFMDQVVRNGYVNLRNPDYDYWLVSQGTLNSVGMPEKTNKELRQLFLSAHQRGIEVVALSLTPWGADSDKRRWAGINGLDYKAKSQIIVDFMLGRSNPEQALGRYLSVRDNPDAPWSADETPEISIDLYDSPMRDRDAALRDVAAMREALAKDKDWQKAHADLGKAAYEAALDADAQAAAEIPRWYMRKELQAFDHIHPNEHGHRLIAEIMCPQLPASWGCSCPSPPAGR